MNWLTPHVNKKALLKKAQMLLWKYTGKTNGSGTES